jgi:hypothetical protein
MLLKFSKGVVRGVSIVFFRGMVCGVSVVFFRGMVCGVNVINKTYILKVGVSSVSILTNVCETMKQKIMWTILF